MDCITFIKMRSRKDLDGFHQKHRVRNIVKILLVWLQSLVSIILSTDGDREVRSSVQTVSVRCCPPTAGGEGGPGDSVQLLPHGSSRGDENSLYRIERNGQEEKS